MSKTEKSVLITGCSSGIGAAAALAMKNAGWRVVATARDPDSLASLANAGCETLALDVTDEASMTAAVAAAGPVHALVNNAGYSQSGALETLDMDAVRRQFETNVFGLLRLTQLVLPPMRERDDGRIINISSMGGKITFPGGGVYHATKFSVEALSDVLRYEVAKFGIKVVIVEPGLIRTKFAEAATAAMATGADSAGGPYGTFNHELEQVMADGYNKGPLAALAGPPEAAAKVIERALTTPKPKTRYKVTASAHVLMGMNKLLTDRMWDGFLGTSFPQPGKT